MSNGNGDADYDILAGLDDKPVKRRQPRWLMSFADMVTLLFAMFAMIVSFADFNKVDKTQFAESAESFREGLNPNEPVYDPRSDTFQVPVSAEEVEKLEEVQRTERIKEQAIEQVKRELKNELLAGLLSVEATVNGVILRFPSATAFSLGGADLSPAMIKTLDRVAGVLRNTPGAIMVSGHTDDLPIGTERFRSNWDLSTARAVSVVHFLIDAKVEPKRMAATGYAETRPLVANDTAEHRAQNRRVQIELVINPTNAQKPAARPKR